MSKRSNQPEASTSTSTEALPQEYHVPNIGFVDLTAGSGLTSSPRLSEIRTKLLPITKCLTTASARISAVDLNVLLEDDADRYLSQSIDWGLARYQYNSTVHAINTKLSNAETASSVSDEDLQALLDQAKKLHRDTLDCVGWRDLRRRASLNLVCKCNYPAFDFSEILNK